MVAYQNSGFGYTIFIAGFQRRFSVCLLKAGDGCYKMAAEAYGQAVPNFGSFGSAIE